jgi:hypothetical protein
MIITYLLGTTVVVEAAFLVHEQQGEDVGQLLRRQNQNAQFVAL